MQSFLVWKSARTAFNLYLFYNLVKMSYFTVIFHILDWCFWTSRKHPQHKRLHKRLNIVPWVCTWWQSPFRGQKPQKRPQSTVHKTKCWILFDKSHHFMMHTGTLSLIIKLIVITLLWKFKKNPPLLRHWLHFITVDICCTLQVNWKHYPCLLFLSIIELLALITAAALMNTEQIEDVVSHFCFTTS